MWDFVGAGALVGFGMLSGWLIGSRHRVTGNVAPRLPAGTDRRVPELQIQKTELLDVNKRLRESVQGYEQLREATRRFSEDMVVFRKPEFVDENYLYGNHMLPELRALHMWAADGQKVCHLVQQMSSAAKRNLEEHCLMRAQKGVAPDEPPSPVLDDTAKLFNTRPVAVQKNMFELTQEEFDHLERWSKFLLALGWPAYSSLCSLTNAADVAWYRAVKAKHGEEQEGSE